jgi:hypothetical protein
MVTMLEEGRALWGMVVVEVAVLVSVLRTLVVRVVWAVVKVVKRRGKIATRTSKARPM